VLPCLLLLPMQLPHKLGVLASSLTHDDCYKAGTGLAAAVAYAASMLLLLLDKAGISASGQASALWPVVQQQMVESGLISCLQSLIHGTAQQLERSTAAAAAAIAESAAAARD
jgi:small ligand-binding sensory domain FIST